MRNAVFARVTLAALVLALPATAGAPQDPPQYEQFDRDSTEITDNFTKLTWDRSGILEDRKQADGDFYCSATVFPGSGRLPTVKELLTLVDEDLHDEWESGKQVPKAIDHAAFPDTPTAKPYWTSTPTGDGRFFAVDFASGKTQIRGADELLYARCVR